jgi:hypothetical protein
MRLLPLVLQNAAGLHGAARVDGRGVPFDVLDHAFLVDHKSGAIGKPPFFIENAVLGGNRPLEIAEDGKGDANLLGEFPVGGLTVNADTQNLGTRFFECGDISLIRLELLRSATREGQNIERQDNVLLPPKIAQLDDPALLIGKREIRSPIPNFEWRCLHQTRRRQGQNQEPHSRD